MKLKKYSYNVVKSTNDVSFRKIRSNSSQGAIISNNQTIGRGRYGKKWISIKGNLFMSIFYEIQNNTNLKNLTKIYESILKT